MYIYIYNFFQKGRDVNSLRWWAISTFFLRVRQGDGKGKSTGSGLLRLPDSKAEALGTWLPLTWRGGVTRIEWLTFRRRGSQ